MFDTVFQLKAEGDSAQTNGFFTARSASVFRSVGAAEKRIPAFIEGCIDESSGDYAYEEGLVISIIPLNILAE